MIHGTGGLETRFKQKRAILVFLSRAVALAAWCNNISLISIVIARVPLELKLIASSLSANDLASS